MMDTIVASIFLLGAVAATYILLIRFLSSSNCVVYMREQTDKKTADLLLVVDTFCSIAGIANSQDASLDELEKSFLLILDRLHRVQTIYQTDFRERKRANTCKAKGRGKCR